MSTILECKNLSKAYGSRTALSQVSLTLEGGHIIGLLGPNGSGKTTFIKLLCRLYDPTEGEILLNGINIKKYDYEEYKAIFSVVFQDFKLFAFPVWQNITAGNVRQDDRIWTALQQADALETVKKLPEGLASYLYKDLEEGGADQRRRSAEACAGTGAL